MIIIQARSNSTRFPGKIYEIVKGIPLIEYSIRIAHKSRLPYIVAIPKNDKKLAKFLTNRDIPYFEGSEHDVLDRFYQCAKKYRFSTIIRLCADTVYLHNDLSDMFNLYKKRGRFTYGNGVFILSFDELEYAWKNATGDHREHVTTFLYRSVDYRADLERSPIRDNITMFL